MPDTTIPDKLNEHDVHFAKIDMVLENLTRQSETFETAVKQFQVAITQLQSQADYRGKALSIVGSIVMLIAGVFAGQFIHIHP